MTYVHQGDAARALLRYGRIPRRGLLWLLHPSRRRHPTGVRLFATGLRTADGKLPLTGYPRITRPRRRKNADWLSGFSLIDPAGNWIGVIRDAAVDGPPEPVAAGRLTEAEELRTQL